jgi:leader peptidase (prepilin peptidase) / N-methyltransferase
MIDLVTIFDSEPYLLVGTMTALGLLVGSFLNVVIFRLPVVMEREWKSECRALLELDEPPAEIEPFDLIRPRSRCPHCRSLIKARDNVPVFSYLLLRGRCRYCDASISLRYPAIELVAGLAAGYAAWHFGVRGDPLTVELLAKSVAAAAFVWALIALAVIDLDTHLLPDSITLPLLWAGIGLGFFGLFAGDLKAAVLGAMLGYLSLWSVYWVFKLVTGKEGMGYGDFKLLAALGAWMGWQALPSIILISSAIGAVIGITMIVTGLIARSEPIPFGPYLALAGIVALFWEQPLARLFTGSVVL